MNPSLEPILIFVNQVHTSLFRLF